MEIAEALKNLDEEKVLQLVDGMISRGVSPLDIIDECNKGMVEVGELFASGEYFLSELVFSGEILNGVMNRLDPLLKATDAASRPALGKVVIGTVKGDIHDIGKNIVVSLLAGNGFDVIDVGVDAPAAKFVQAVTESGAKVLGLSALLNSTFPEMRSVVEAVDRAGLRNSVSIVIGGAPCNEQVREFTGADYYAPDAVAGVKICKQLYGQP